MINPIMLTIHSSSLSLPVRWYGVIIMAAIVIAAWLAEREVRRRGENGDHIWIAPTILIGQAVGRIANFINQELYGQPATLPWGIPISAEHLKFLS